MASRKLSDEAYVIDLCDEVLGAVMTSNRRRLTAFTLVVS